MSHRILCCLAAASLWTTGMPAMAQTGPGTTQSVDPPASAPADSGRGGPLPDLRTLLAPAQSPLNLVSQRYTLDRTSVSRFYEIPTGRNLTRGAGAAPPTEFISSTRIARLKRFDLDWVDALNKIDAARLTPPAQQDLAALKSAVQTNLKQLDAQTLALAEITPLLPFAGPLVKLEEARRHMDSLDAEKSAATLAQATRDIAAFRKTLEAALTNDPPRPSVRLSKSTALRAAAVVDGLQSTLRDWYDFYYDFDPLFTWWIPNPYKELNAALTDYAAFLRTNVAPVAAESMAAVPPPAPIAAAAAPAWNEVPDLQELLAFPQNELTSIEQRFGSAAAGGGGGRGAGRGARTPQQATEWLAALQQLDFDHLSRNAQVDYLRMRNSLDIALQRANTPPQANIPRKVPNEMLNGQRLIAPIGHQALAFALAEEMIPYSPEELVALAENEFKWCDNEMTRAARDMGVAGMKQAIEVAKNNHVPAGKQPDMIRDILRDDVAFLRAHDLVTVPEIDYETLRMEMMSAQRQLVNPYFTGGSIISVSYPVGTMTTQQRLESMRGNNHAFAQATVHHELIPGHNLTWYLTPRYRPARGGNLGDTPFFTEGWAVYWEMQFYDLGFGKSAEDRVGFLFWRMMRCARIVFSLKYHLGLMSGQECVEYLVDRVASEPENAAAEITRSFNGSYPPLHQAGYLLGALQFRGLHQELVDSGQMTNRQFHDAVLQQPTMPVALVRLALSRQKLTADMPLDWKFYGPINAK